MAEAVAAPGSAFFQLHEAEGLCHEILNSIIKDDHLSNSIRWNVRFWMESFQDVLSLLNSSNMPQHELQFFVHNMGKINSGLRDLRKIVAKNQRRVKFMPLGDEIQSLLNRIDAQFSLVKRFQQTASDLQPFHQRALVESLANVPPRPTNVPGTTQPQTVFTGLQDEIYIYEVGEQAFSFPDQMVFESGHNFVLTLKETTSDTTNADKLFEQKDGHEGLQQWLQGLRGAQNTTKEVTIVVCGEPTKKDQGAVTMKDEAVLLDVLKTLKAPLTCVHRLLDGIPMLIEHKANPPSTGTCFTFRLPLSKNQDWTLGIYWNPSHQAINAFIHGMQDVERLAFSGKVTTALADIHHPMLLPVIFCELLTAGDLASVRGTTNQLHEVEKETQWSGVFYNEMDVERATRILNAAISILPTREASTKANMLLVGRILEFISEIAIKHCPKEEGDNTRKNEALWKSTNRLRARLQTLQATQNALLLEVARECQIASSQLQIVYNLVAQRDNKNNYEMARISLKISRTAKDDSFAMFTLAVMSILFLPGAFIATLFSMDLFNWSAKKGERVINSRFWMYWVITLPLTLIVLTGWLFWLKIHQMDEDRKQKDEAAANGKASAVEDANVGGVRLLWTRYLRRRKTPKTSSQRPEMTPDVEMNQKDDDDPPRVAVETAVLVGTEALGVRGLEQARREAAAKRSYTFAARGVRRD